MSDTQLNQSIFVLKSVSTFCSSVAEPSSFLQPHRVTTSVAYAGATFSSMEKTSSKHLLMQIAPRNVWTGFSPCLVLKSSTPYSPLSGSHSYGLDLISFVIQIRDSDDSTPFMGLFHFCSIYSLFIKSRPLPVRPRYFPSLITSCGFQLLIIRHISFFGRRNTSSLIFHIASCITFSNGLVVYHNSYLSSQAVLQHILRFCYCDSAGWAHFLLV